MQRTIDLASEGTSGQKFTLSKSGRWERSQMMFETGCIAIDINTKICIEATHED